MDSNENPQVEPGGETTVLPVPHVGHSDALTFPAPIHDNVIIEVEEVPSERKTESGLFIPVQDQARKHPVIGVIRAVGQGRPTDKGVHQALTVEVGDRVLFDHQPHVAYGLLWNGKPYIVTRELYIHAILPQAQDEEAP